jgi:hypothetical protein
VAVDAVQFLSSPKAEKAAEADSETHKPADLPQVQQAGLATIWTTFGMVA